MPWRHQCGHPLRRRGSPLPGSHSPVVVCDRPGSGAWINAKARNQVHMQVGSPFAEGDGIHPIAARELTHKGTGPLHGRPPSLGFLGGEVSGATEVAAAIKHQPARQGRWVWMVAEQPQLAAADLVKPTT